MKLSKQQIDYFETFGFLKFPGLFTDDIHAITKEFDRLMKQHTKDHPHEGKQRTLKWQFIDSSKYLSTLLDDPRIEGLLSSLLGDDFLYAGGTGNYYVGNTGWHVDDETEHRRVKISFYLDPVDATSGALRVIPGSHHVGQHIQYLREHISTCYTTWGIGGDEVPATVLDVTPGDLLVFDHRILHSSWGGNEKRRMFSINAHTKYTEENIHLLKEHISALSRFWCDHVYGDILVQTATPQRMRHLEQMIQNEGHLPALCEIARQTTSEPAKDNDFEATEDVLTARFTRR